MTNNFSNVMDYKVVANNVVNYVESFSNDTVWVFNRDNRTNGGSMKWQIEKVGLIRDYFTFTDGADEGLDVRVYVNANGISVKVWFNNKEYHNEKPITSKCGKKMIKDILDDMGVVKDVIDVYTNNMVNNNMEENNMVDMVNNVDLFNAEMKHYVMEDYNDAISSAKDFADAYGDDCVENEYLCGTMDYEYDIREMWADWAWHGDVCDTFNDARNFYDEHKDLFISMEDIDNIVEGLDGTDDVGNGECLVWVKNPYYVEQEQVENDTPCLDDVDRVVKVIEDYVNNYTMSYLDNYGGCVVCVPWDVFDEDDMKMLIEDADFEEYVVDVLMGRDIKDVLVYDDGVYVSVDAKMFDKVA